MSGNRSFSGDNTMGPSRWSGSIVPNYGFSNQNNQGYIQSYNQYSGFNHTPTDGSGNHTPGWNKGTGNYSNMSNNGTGNSFNDASYENYYGMAPSGPSNYNSSTSLNYGTNANLMSVTPNLYNQSCNLPNSGNIHGNAISFSGSNTSNNTPGGKKKKGVKRPLPDDPKERKRIKNNNRSNKKRAMGFKPPTRAELTELAAKNAPEGFDVTTLSKKNLKKLANPELSEKKANKVLDVSELNKNALVAIASKHVSERVNVQAFTKRGLRAFLKQVDPKFKPPANVSPPVGKKTLRKKNSAARQASKLIEADKLALVTPINNVQDTTLSNPIKVIVTVSARKEHIDKTRKIKKRNMDARSIRSRYSELRKANLNENKGLDYNGLVLAGYLKFALFQIYPEDRVDCFLVSENVFDHPNVLKLLQYEVKKLLEQKFGPHNSSSNTYANKRDFLMSLKQEVLEEDGQVVERSFLLDGCIDILMSDVYPAELIPTPIDYMRDPTVTPTHEKSTEEFQFLFITYVYEALGFVITDTLDRETKIKLHLDNAIIPALLVEFVRSYDTYVEITPFQMFFVKPGDRLALPSAIKNYLTRKNNIGYLRNPQLGKLYTKLKKDNTQMQTKILDVLPEGTKPSAILLRDFANIILFSDEMLSLAKYKLIEHTPFIALSREEKLEMFNGLVKRTYGQAFHICESKLSIHDMTFKEV